MKLQCERDVFAQALATVSRAASSHSAINVLTGIRLEGLADCVALTATDTELSIRAGTAATVGQGGVGVVPARTLLELVKRLPEGPLALDAYDSSTLRLISGEGEYRLTAFSAEDFPEIPTPILSATLRVDRAPFVEAFARVGPVAARDASRPVFTGILVAIADGALTMVATDAHRLAVIRCSISASLDLAPTLIPARALLELARLGAKAEYLDLIVGENVIVFEVGNYRITARRLNGQFQKWEPLVEAEFAHEAVIDRSALLAAVERVGVFVQRGRPVVLEFDEAHVVVRVTSGEIGQATERVPLEKPGPRTTVAFNPGYLIDGLQLLAAPQIHMRMNDPLRPVVLCDSNGDYTYLVAPVRPSEQS